MYCLNTFQIVILNGKKVVNVTVAKRTLLKAGEAIRYESNVGFEIQTQTSSLSHIVILSIYISPSICIFTLLLNSY